MKKQTKRTVIIGGLTVAALTATALASSYFTRQSMAPQPAPQVAARTQSTPAPRAQLAATNPSRPPCDDNNIVGTVAGGAAGGLIGSRFGSGNGKTAATAGGIIGGAMLGNAYMPTRGVTCN